MHVFENTKIDCAKISTPELIFLLILKFVSVKAFQSKENVIHDFIEN